MPFTQVFQTVNQHLSTPRHVTLVFLDEEAMFLMNNQLRQKPRATDVLSLALDDTDGEVYICPLYIFNQGHDTDRIIHLFVHGLLHCAGYTHDTDVDLENMQALETKILLELNYRDPYA